MVDELTVSIVMLVKNELANLQQSLPVILRQETACSYEVIVIDSGSTDGSVEYVRELALADARLHLCEIPPQDFHHARTRNYGASIARGPFVVFLGGDAIPQRSSWLDELTRPVIAGAAEGIAASYGRQVPKPNADSANFCRVTFNYGTTSFVKSRDKKLTQKDLFFFSSVNCCVNRRVVPLPFFDETYPVDEDATLSRRLIAEGKKIAYCADAVVSHSHNYTLAEIFQRSFDNGVVYSKLGIFDRRDSAVRQEGRRYVQHALTVLRDRGAAEKLRFFSFFVASGIGAQLGLHHDLLPQSWRRVLSKYGTA